MLKLSKTFGLGLLLLSTIFLLELGNTFWQSNKNFVASASSNNTKAIHKNASSSKQQIKVYKKVAPVNWLNPTGGKYPVIRTKESIWIKVSKEKQRVYIMNGNKAIYTMICSSGLDTNPNTSTPTGTFYIQAERGLSFYNPSEKEGAKYWVSWKGHGKFLFHTVATDKNGHYIKSEALKLGHKASHGCIRLSVSDAKWIYDHIKYHTKVMIN